MRDSFAITGALVLTLHCGSFAVT